MLATPQPASKMTGGPGNVPTDLSKTAHGPFRTPKSSPRRLPGASPSTLRAALGPPEELPGAAKAEICKRLQREHQLQPPSESTLHTWYHPASGYDSLCSDASSWSFSPTRSLRPPSPPDPRGRRIDWAAPTAADPEKRISRPAIEKGPLRFYLRAFRRTVQPRRIMPATLQPASKMTGGPENAATELSQTA